jgi:hypothetical protein
MRVRYDGGWTSIESAAGSVLLVNMRPDPADPPPLSQWAAAGLASGYEPLDRDLEEELEVESENPAFSAHLQEMELASRLLAEGGERTLATVPCPDLSRRLALQLLAHSASRFSHVLL